MLRTFLIASSLLIASSVQAAPRKKCSVSSDADGRRVKSCFVYVQHERVLDNITITPENGGFNPAFAAYTVNGRVEVGGNSCQAQGLKAYLRQRTVAGQLQIVAGVQGWQKEGQVCILVYAPVYEYVSRTVRGQGDQLASAVIKNAEEFGVDAALTSSCFEPVFCTKEYQPNVCTFQGKEYRGNNRCEATSKARKAACLQNIELDAVECQPEAFEF